VQTETRQCDVNCWELRITDAEGNVTVHYFSDPSLMDRAAMKAHRDWEDFGWCRNRSTTGCQQATAFRSSTTTRALHCEWSLDSTLNTAERS
jgi:hypothetical protein